MGRRRRSRRSDRPRTRLRRSEPRRRARNRTERRPGVKSPGWARLHERRNETPPILSREHRGYLMGKRPFLFFFVKSGVDPPPHPGFRGKWRHVPPPNRDMGAIRRDHFPQQMTQGRRGRTLLSDLKWLLKTPAWFGPHGRLRGGQASNFEEIDIDRRAKRWAPDISRISGVFRTGPIDGGFLFRRT